MPKVAYEIDPDPDTVIILKNPAETFAAWDASEPKKSEAI
jgi:hypothetical protein